MSTQTTTTTARRPRIRHGAVVWGLVEAVAALLLLMIASDPTLRTQVVDRALEMEATGIGAVAVAVFGLIALLVGLVRVLDRR